jgi:dephospho-CoA kinase
MFLIGLTGGIASGKSTVADLWQSMGADVIDADELARLAVAPNSIGLKNIVARFGNQVLLESGELDRKALASIVFNDQDSRKSLESILHPLIRELSLDRIKSSESKLVVYVIPLLVETKSNLPFDYVVTVEAPESVRLERLKEKRRFSEAEAKARIDTQASAVDRANVADRILNSNQELPRFLNDSRLLFAELEKLALQKEDSHGQ